MMSSRLGSTPYLCIEGMGLEVLAQVGTTLLYAIFTLLFQVLTTLISFQALPVELGYYLISKSWW